VVEAQTTDFQHAAPNTQRANTRAPRAWKASPVFWAAQNIPRNGALTQRMAAVKN